MVLAPLRRGFPFLVRWRNPLAVFSWWTEFRAQQQICCHADDDESHNKHRRPIGHFPSVCLSLEQDSKREGHRAVMRVIAAGLPVVGLVETAEEDRLSP